MPELLDVRLIFKVAGSLDRYRLGEAPLRNLFDEVAAPVADERMPDAFCGDCG